MDLRLSGKVAAVTGASRGIGLAITQALADEGVIVVAGSRSVSDGLSKLAADSHVLPVLTDLATPDGPGHLIDEAISTYGGLDILINNVGAVRPHLDGFSSITDQHWDDALLINFLAAVRTTRAALPHLINRGSGTIVTISSVNAFLPDPTIMDYTASKAALSNFSKALSKEVGSKGIRVNTVSPGPVSTELWLGDDGVAATIAESTAADPEAVAAKAAADAVTGRFTTPEEVADLVLLLVSGRAANVTGADFVIDGGLVNTL
jgi:NAD(P)-dependent dehydrogenase (short-subunit alcohol dehydrogenase family)